MSKKDNDWHKEFSYLIEEWDLSKNIKKLEKFTIGSGYKACWICRKNKKHKWVAVIGDRTGKNRTGCPYCINKKAGDENNFLYLCPETARGWHPTKNGDKKPENFTKGSGYNAWWLCEKNIEHEWQTSINHRSRNGCPYCSNHKICQENNLLFKFPEVAKKWHPKKNGNKKPEDFVFGSNEKVWWQCDKNHEWKAKISKQIKKDGVGCPYCNNSFVCEDNNLKILFPEISESWHPSKNLPLIPENILAGSNKKVWWICDKFKEHEWKTSVYCRTGDAKSGCPYCSNNKICDNNNLLFLFPNVAKEWDYLKNGNNRPEHFSPGSGYNAFWICEKKKHEWQATIKNRAGVHNQNACPYCTNKKVCEDNNLLFKFPDVAAEWNYEKNGDKKPEDFVFGSNAKVWWRCLVNKTHEWEAIIAHRTAPAIKVWCPHCKTLWGENILKIILEEALQVNFTKARHSYLINPKTNYPLELDGYCSSLNLAFEYQGRHHYIQLKNRENLEAVQERDLLKKQLCENLGIKLIIIPQFKEILKEKDVIEFILNELNKFSIPIKNKILSLEEAAEVFRKRQLENSGF